MKKFMGLLVVFMVLWVTGAFAAPHEILDFLMQDPTSTTIHLTFEDAGASSDTTTIRAAGADSTIIATISNTVTDTTITGLTPHTQYIWYIKTTSTLGVTYYGNLDTLYTAYPNIESSKQVAPSKWMWGARSWVPDDISYDSLYCGTATGLDSTMVYWAKEYTGFQAKMIAPHADSSKVMLYVFNGRAEETNPKNETSNNVTGTWDFGIAAMDSLNITTNGWQVPKLINFLSPTDHFYIRADGQANNGKSTKLLIRLFRRGL